MRQVLLTILLLALCFPAYATTYVSDHFDAQDDWSGATSGDCADPGSDTDDSRKPPAPWDYKSCSHGKNNDISATGAHGGSGKGYTLSWPTSMAERAISKEIGTSTNEFWIGFWFKHNSDWSWGSESVHKWIHAYGTMNTFNINYQPYHKIIDALSGEITGDLNFDITDGTWHYYIIYLKHNTSGNSDGEIRIWKDATEAGWTQTNAPTVDNYDLTYDSGSSSWPANITFQIGFQSRDGWPATNVSSFDDIIIASTQAEVETFLGVAAGGGGGSGQTAAGSGQLLIGPGYSGSFQ